MLLASNVRLFEAFICEIALYLMRKKVCAICLKEFHREGNGTRVDYHKLPVPVSARYIRFNPTKQHEWNCLRVEVYNNSKGKLSPFLLYS